MGDGIVRTLKWHERIGIQSGKATDAIGRGEPRHRGVARLA